MMRWPHALVLVASGIVGLACAQGSGSLAGDELTSSNEPTRPSSVVDAAVAETAPTADAAAAETSDDATTTSPDAAPTTFVNGSAAGVSIAPAHAGAIEVMASGAVDRLVIAVTTRAGFCSDYASGIDHAGERTLVLAVLSKGLTSSVEPGTYTIGNGKPSSVGGSFDTSARILSYDGQCKTTVPAASEYATSGTLTFTQVAGALAVGTFTLSFTGGGSLTGSLEADVCTAPGAGSFTCVP